MEYIQMVVEVTISAFADTTLVSYVYKNCEKKSFYIWRFLCAMFIYMTGVLGCDLLYIDNGPRMIINSLITLTSGLLLFKTSSLSTYLKNTIVMYVCVNVGDVLTVLPMWFVQNSNDVQFLENFIVWFIALVVSRALAAVFIRIINKYRVANQWKKGKLQTISSFLLFAGCYLYIILMTVVMLSEKYDIREFWTMQVISLVLILLLVIGFFVMNQAHEQKENIKRELEVVKQKNRFQIEAYQKQRETELELRKMYHDIKNLGLLVEAYREKGVDTKEADKYIEKIQAYGAVLAQDITTGNEIMDIFFKEKQKECLDENIELIFKADLSKWKFVNDVDLGTIFGNILDNAKEACEKIEDIEERKINFRAGTYENFLVIKCENPTVGINKNKGRLLTTKADKENHGLGMICLRETLQNYQGEYSYKIEQGKFIISAFIPMKNERKV